MAADVQVKADASNSCCAAWRNKYSKLEEKRNALRQAVKLLEQQIDKIQAQSKKVCEDERAKADFEKEAKEKESAARLALENEVAELKSEILSLKQKGGRDVQESDGDVKLLQACMSELEKEINHLKEAVQKERKRADSERKIAEAEKKKAAEAQRAVEDERSKAEKERNVAKLENDGAEKYRLQIEILRKEADETKSKLASGTLKLEEANKKLEAEKQKLAKEKKRADSERAKAEEQRKLAEDNVKKHAEASLYAESLSRQLEESKIVEEAHKSELVLELSRKLEEANKRFQLEKQKASREKERAATEMLKSVEHKKVAEVNWKKSQEEKSRADQLCRQLEEYKRSTNELQKKIQEFSNRKFSIGESMEFKLLKKKLKLEKMQKKHAKQVADLERSRNGILQQEVGRLKLEFDEFSCRLDMLHKSFSPRTEGRDGLVKTGHNMARSDMKNLCGPKSFRMYLQSHNQLLKPTCQTLGFSGTFRETSQHTACLCPMPGGNCIEHITGIDSKLESPLGGSPRTMLKGSAINSSTTSFSDGQLVGSQDKGALSVATSVKLAKEYAQPTFADLSAEVTRMRSSENLAVVAENSVRSPVVGKGTMHGRKRKRMVDTVDTIENLYFEDKKLHLQIEEKLADLHGMLNKRVEKPLGEEKFLLPSSLGTSYAKNDKLPKKRKTSFQEKVVTQHASKSNELNKREEVEPEVNGNANSHKQASVTRNDDMGTSGAFGEGTRDSFADDVEAVAGFNDLADVDFMNLLNLDNPADEEYYRLAMEMPLSPLLPGIEIQHVETFNVDNKIPLGKEAICQEFSNREEVLPSGRFDNDLEICFNRSMSDGCATLTNSLVHENENFVNSPHIAGNDLHNSAVDNASGCRIGESGVEVERSNATVTGDEKIKFPFEAELGPVGNSTLEQCVVFSNIEDISSISRIYHAIRSCSLATQSRWMLRDILLAIKIEDELSTKEKACTLFSLLMVNFSVAALHTFGNHLNWASIHCLDSFAGHVHSVMTDVEMRNWFSEVGCLDELFNLIENFLIDGCVKVFRDAPFTSSAECDSRVNIPSDGSKITLSSVPASGEQLVAGSIILASICVALGHIGFICEASYNILRACSFGNSLMLTILHVFAYLGGEKFFSSSDCSLMMTTLKSVVRNLEEVSVSASCVPLVNDPQVVFSPCVKCPFVEDGVSVDTVTSFLLEKLRNVILEDMHQHAVEPVCCAHLIDNDGTFCLNKYNIFGNQSDPHTTMTLSSLSDLLAFVELVAWHMGWEWTWVKIVPQLLKLLEPHVFENSISGVVLLLGQLGRLGVRDFGYEDKRVEQLRCDLSAFLRLGIMRKASLPIQLASVSALLGLLSVDFESIIQTNEKLPSIVSESGAADLFRTWFSSLSKKQRDLSFKVLQTGGVRNQNRIC